MEPVEILEFTTRLFMVALTPGHRPIGRFVD